MRRVLVTGGHGFVGSHLVRRLVAAGDAVRCLVRGDARPAALEGLAVEVVRGDLTRPETLLPALQGVEEVFHLAARLTASCRREMLETNALGTRRLLQAVVLAGSVRRFVHCSSVAVCGPSEGGPPLTEDAPLHPRTWYGESKALAERIVRAFGSRGLPWTIVRPPIVYGPRDRGLLPVFRSAARGWKPVLGRRAKTYSWVYGDDLAEGLLAIGRAERTLGGAYFAGHAEALEMEAFLDLVLRAAGRRGLRIALPEHLLGLVAAGSDLVAQATGRPGMLTRDKMREITPRAWVCSSAAAERDAGWKAKTAAADGVPATLAWYRENGWL